MWFDDHLEKKPSIQKSKTHKVLHNKYFKKIKFLFLNYLKISGV